MVAGDKICPHLHPAATRRQGGVVIHGRFDFARNIRIALIEMPYLAAAVDPVNPSRLGQTGEEGRIVNLVMAQN